MGENRQHRRQVDVVDASFYGGDLPLVFSTAKESYPDEESPQQLKRSRRTPVAAL